MRIDWTLACNQQWSLQEFNWYVFDKEFHQEVTKDRTEPGSDLEKLVKDATPLGPIERADLLYNSQALERAHQSAAVEGQSAAPNAEDNIDLHYVCFVKDEKNNLWEMDGRRKGPLNRGHLGPDDDVLSEKALALGVRKFLKREEEAGGGELRFSLITLAPNLDFD